MVIPHSETFESVCVRLRAADGQFLLLTVYRPGSTKPTSAFFDEFAALLKVLALQITPIVVDSDLKIRLNEADANSLRG